MLIAWTCRLLCPLGPHMRWWLRRLPPCLRTRRIRGQRVSTRGSVEGYALKSLRVLGVAINVATRFARFSPSVFPNWLIRIPILPLSSKLLGAADHTLL